MPIVAAALARDGPVPQVVGAATVVTLRDPRRGGGLGGRRLRCSRGAIRVTLWGMAAMALTAAAGSYFGAEP